MWSTVAEQISQAFNAGLTTEECRALLILAKEYIDKTYKRPVNVYSRARVLARQLGGEDFKQLVASVLKQSKEEYEATIKEQEARVEKRNEQVHTICEERVMKVILSSLASSDPVDWVIGLQLMSGARLREIIDEETSKFVQGKDSKTIVQIGAAKNPNKEVTLEKQLIGGEASLFITTLGRLRDALKSAQISKPAINNRVNRYTKAQFPVTSERTGSHLNRAIYAAFFRLKNESWLSPCRSIQRCLGHVAMATAPHYMHVRVVEGDQDDIGHVDDPHTTFRRYATLPGQKEQKMEEVRAKLLQIPRDQLTTAHGRMRKGVLGELKISRRTLNDYKFWELCRFPRECDRVFGECDCSLID